MKRPIYIWQYPDWPHFVWDYAQIATSLAEVRNLQGRLVGQMQTLGFDFQQQTTLDTMVLDIIKSSEIEGVELNMDNVRSSVARHLGLPTEGLPTPDHYTEGVVQVMIDAVSHASEKISAERLFGWHAALFPSGRSGMYKITVADWRKGAEPMQIVSGAIGNERVHYQAPPSERVAQEMDRFIEWFNSESTIDPVLKAAIAHLWFVVVHPFDDGNGRIARTLTDMLMTRADAIPHRFYSLSAIICQNKKEYYDILEYTTVRDVDITRWLSWFLDATRKSISDAISVAERILSKAQFWSRFRHVPMNERQTRMINMLWDGFEGNLTNAKWARITKVSSATALRDIQELVANKVLILAESGGRSTHYLLSPN